MAFMSQRRQQQHPKGQKGGGGGMHAVLQMSKEMDAMRSMLESSWNSASMGSVPTSPQSAAEAAASSIHDALNNNSNNSNSNNQEEGFTTNKLFLINIDLPSFDRTSGPNLYDDVQAVEFCVALSQFMQEEEDANKTLILIRNANEVSYIQRFLDKKQQSQQPTTTPPTTTTTQEREEINKGYNVEFFDDFAEIENPNDNNKNDENENPPQTSSSSSQSSSSSPVFSYNDFDDFGSIADTTNKNNIDDDTSPPDPNMDQTITNDDENNDENDNNQDDDDDDDEDNHDQIENDIDAFRKKLTLGWTEETPPPPSSTEQQDQENPTITSSTPTIPTTTTYRLASFFGHETISNGADMFQDVIDAVHKNAMTNDEDTIIILCPTSQSEMIAVRRLLALYQKNKTFIFVNSRLNPIPRELIMAETVYSIMPLLARPTVSERNIFGQNNQQQQEDNKAPPKIVVLRRYPKDWELYIDMNDGSGFDWVDSIPAHQVEQNGPSMEWIAASVKRHMQFKFGTQ